jgi:hypothetical protein
MADHASLSALPWWRRLAPLARRILTTEPALVHAVVGALVMVGLIWGPDFTSLGEQINKTADIVAVIVPLLIGWWTRGKVTPVTSLPIIPTQKVAQWLADAAAVRAPDAKED